MSFLFKITESYAFLPRDAVTKFLAGCQFCKKSAKPHSPSSLIADDVFTESSSETDPLNAGSGIFSENSDSQLTIDSTIETKISDKGKIMDEVLMKKEDEINKLPCVDWEEAISLEKNRNISIVETHSASLQMIEQMNGTQQKTYFDEIYSKIQQYYGYQINNNADIKDLAASNDLLNYYTLLKTFYDQSVAAHKLGIKSTETLLHSSQLNTQHYSNNSSLIIKEEPIAPLLTEPIIDLTISRPEEFKNNININIENGSTTSTNSTVACTNTSESSENNITINSAGVSINVLNNSKELKISCKTTPPKKRYSVYNHEDNTSSSKVNLSEKFNQNSDVGKITDTENVAVDYNAGKQPQTTSRDENIFYSKKYSTQVNDVKPITSTYLQLMRSMGFCDDDALKFDNLVSNFFY